MNLSAKDQQDFEKILHQYQALLWKVARAYCSNLEDQKDLIQEIALQLWRAYPKYNPKFAITTWMYRIALNVAISNLRKQKRRTEAQLPEYPPPEEGEEVQEQLDFLYQLIQQLPPLDKALILLYLEEVPQQEIAEIMGISLSNVSTRINRIKQKLKKLTNKWT